MRRRGRGRQQEGVTHDDCVDETDQPGQLEVTFGDPVPYTPTEQLAGMFNQNQNPVAVEVTVTNHGKQEHPGLSFWLITSDGSNSYGISNDPDVVAKIPPGDTNAVKSSSGR